MSSSSRSNAPERGGARARPGRGGAHRLLACALVLSLAQAGAWSRGAATFATALQGFAGHVVGEARLTWFGLHVYDARLVASPKFDPSAPFTHPFALELTYGRSLDGRAIAETSRDEIARLGFGTALQRQAWFERMVALFPDVQRGTRIAGVNVPGRGVDFYVDGGLAGSIDDVAFARAFFAIWLDPRTRSPEVRRGLLRRASATIE
jgi:hypothetical protein